MTKPTNELNLNPFKEMNETLWNSTEEAFGYFLMGAMSILIHAYAMFLCKCSAISDYQDEKPKHEKSSFDEFITELMNFQFLTLIYSYPVHWPVLTSN